jgi:hypothetical protein
MAVRPKCYILYPVKDNPAELQEILYWSVLPDDAVTNNGFYNFNVTISGVYGGTYYVVLNPDQNNCPSPSTVVVTGEPTAVAAYCYYVTSGAITYVNTDDVLSSAAGPTNICTKIIPQVSTTSGTPAIVFNGECVEGQPCVSQPTCYLLTNCADPLIVIQSTSSALETFWAQNKIVSLVGEDGCWTISKAESVEDCDCAVSVVVSKSYGDCTECLPVIAYRLTNCSDGSVKFTEDDLSQYVGKTIKIDCEGCWTVDQINIKPPTSETITVIEEYEDCVLCLRKYWLLSDCNGSVAPIITYTDMTQYEGQIIKITNDDTCWNVEPTDLTYNPVEVEVFGTYVDCFTCGPNLDCNCIRLTNDSTETKTYTYEGCYTPSNTAPLILTITLEPNESSDKMCIARFITVLTSTDIVDQYGACVENPNLITTGATPFFDLPPFVCPTVFTGRAVTPGYTVPACSIEKYESISCKASEILYKQVLQQRYGINNCCPEEDEIWLIRKELLDLAAMRDVNYNCEPISACCAPAQCGCSTCGS